MPDHKFKLDLIMECNQHVILLPRPDLKPSLQHTPHKYQIFQHSCLLWWPLLRYGFLFCPPWHMHRDFVNQILVLLSGIRDLKACVAKLGLIAHPSIRQYVDPDTGVLATTLPQQWACRIIYRGDLQTMFGNLPKMSAADDGPPPAPPAPGPLLGGAPGDCLDDLFVDPPAPPLQVW